MTCRAILEYPDPRLRRRAQTVVNFDATLQGLVDDLFETLYASRGIGLAAPQIDVPLQVVAIDISGTASAPQVFINPLILARSRIGTVEESCLSLPGVSGLVKRPTQLRVRAQDRNGVAFERDLDGLLAVCLGHEIDHLAGRLFIDALSFFQRLRLRRRLAHTGVAPMQVFSGGAAPAPAGSGTIVGRG